MKMCRIILILFFISLNYAQELNSFNPDTVKSYRFDTGKMWTFDFPPTDYFEEAYNFSPGDDWYENVRLSALRIPGCSASFITEDGLMITNHHCSDFHFHKIEKEGENFFNNGFYAATMAEERKVPGFTAERLEFIEDVTEEIQQALSEGVSEEDKVENKNKKAEELITKYNEETGLVCELVTLYNGGKYSVYGYRVYTDVRMVLTPEWSVAQFGGNEDNFTYPRYNLDFTIYRVYDDNGQPLKVKNYFKWNPEAPDINDVLFSVGNPGSTNRLLTNSQLEFLRDFTYRNYAFFYDTYYNRLEEAKTVFPEKSDVFEKERQELGNGQKALTGFLKGLKDPYFMARKKDFEKKFQAKVYADENLKSEYGHLWKSIEINTSERRKYADKLSAYKMARGRHSDFFDIAQDVIDYVEKGKRTPVDSADTIKFNPDEFVSEQFGKDFDPVREAIKLGVHVDYLLLNMGTSDENVNKLLNGKKGFLAAEYLLAESQISSPEKLKSLVEKEADEILTCGDPFITFLLATKDSLANMEKLDKEITNSIAINQDLLGRALFECYGTSIPPDANFTLRLTDGVMKNYNYNGTTAPLFTTFYGMYDRYFSHLNKYPWNLPKSWIDNEKKINLATKYNFLTTFDLVGGSSGSAVINRHGEIMGLAFDGNIESLNGDFIFQPEINRSVNVTTGSIHEALKNVYNAERILNEIINGKISE